MLAHRYQIFNDGWGRDLDAGDPNEKRYVAITAVAKRDRESPNEVFNELVSMRLGLWIGLPVPSGMVVQKESSVYFCSCHIDAAGGKLPPADLVRFTEEKPNDACGVMVFDAWIANTDRHDENLWYDYYEEKFFLFDHGHAILGTSGRTHLMSNQDRLGVRVDVPCLSGHIATFNGFHHWYDRILAISESTIHEITKEAATVGVDSGLATDCAEWLLRRREKLPCLFRDSLETFPRLQKSLFDPFGDSNEYFPEYCI